VSELQRNKVPVETLFLDDENHWINRLESQVELYTRIESFLERNLKGGG
jgi:dipeptidyl aminopeptidase/acylaminoacyl peptidase